MSVIVLFLIVFFNPSVFGDVLPEGWFFVGSNPQGYDVEIVSDEGSSL